MPGTRQAVVFNFNLFNLFYFLNNLKDDEILKKLGDLNDIVWSSCVATNRMETHSAPQETMHDGRGQA